MSQPAPVTYRFSTFQELFDTVPADRIELCLSEIGKAWAAAKEVIDLEIGLAQTIAQEEGITLGKDAIRVKLPAVHEWVDDGKGEITATIQYSDVALPVWTPFYFESNLFFDHIHHLEDWQRLASYWMRKKPPMAAIGHKMSGTPGPIMDFGVNTMESGLCGTFL